jgi:hypothetical protein
MHLICYTLYLSKQDGKKSLYFLSVFFYLRGTQQLSIIPTCSTNPDVACLNKVVAAGGKIPGFRNRRYHRTGCLIVSFVDDTEPSHIASVPYHNLRISFKTN